ncbi:DUF5117 domain-containing protein [Duncaniella dubosii]|uniref:DUF5117 domain-containing protein n=1 Tax=Duncaniella dubosii TaxID=2518971 RepID=UPI003F66E12C
MLIRFTRDDNNVYLHLIQTASEVRPMTYQVSFDRNFRRPCAQAFKIANKNKDGVFIDVSLLFFGGNEKVISPIKEANPLAKASWGQRGYKGHFLC